MRIFLSSLIAFSSTMLPLTTMADETTSDNHNVANEQGIRISKALNSKALSDTNIFQGNDDDASFFSLSGYLESYYIKDFNHSSDKTRPGFVYSHNIADQPSINLAMIKGSLNLERVRANIAVGSGTYMRANYAAEPRDLQKIYEANIGIKLSDNNVWLDAGVLPSHIGFESAIGMNNWTVTRSMLADNSPYFETGLRLSHTSEDGKWYVSGLVLTGWQRIQGPDGNSTPSIGHQITYKPNSKVTFNSSSFIGNDKSDKDRKMRYFHNFYGQYQISEQWGLTTGFDIGAEQVKRSSSHYNVWFTPIVIAKYSHSDKLSFTVRGEYYQDGDGVIIATNTPNGFRTSSYSANIDYKALENLGLRFELRKYHSKDKIFQEKNTLSDQSMIATVAATVNF